MWKAWQGTLHYPLITVEEEDGIDFMTTKCCISPLCSSPPINRAFILSGSPKYFLMRLQNCTPLDQDSAENMSRSSDGDGL